MTRLARFGTGGAARGRQTGFTLVELMVGLVLGLFVVLALLTLLINVNRNNSELTKSNRVIENGRFALELLETDIAHAGFWGGFLPQFDDLTTAGMATDVPADYPAAAPVVSAVPDPCADWGALAANPDPQVLAQQKTNLLGIALQSYDIPGTVPSPPTPVCGSRVVAPQGATDALFLRHAETCSAGVGNCPGFVNNELYFQLARCGDTVPTPAYALAQYDPANVDTLFPHRVRAANCATAAYAEKRRFVSSLYYVRRYAVTDGDNTPTLMRSQFSCSSGTCGFGPAEALIEGIQAFRVEIGIDDVSDSGATIDTSTFNTSPVAVGAVPSGRAAPVNWADPTRLNSPTNRGDGIPDRYKHCSVAAPCSALELMNAVAVKIYVLARGESASPGYKDVKTYCLASNCGPGDRIGPFNDGYKRHLFTQTIRLVNVSNRRETPP